MRLLLLFILFIPSVYAALPELFAPSASTMGIGNQPNFNSNDASSNSLIPALSSFSNDFNFSANITTIQTNFLKMKSIVVENTVNSASSSEVLKDFDPNLGLQTIMSIHADMKLFRNSSARFLVSFYTPADKLLEASTSDPYLPTYFAYKSRLQRSLFYLNFANKFNESLGYSLGVITGIQSSGQTNVVARENGLPFEPSLGQMTFNATPSVAPSFSIFKIWGKDHSSYLSYISSMKSNFTNEAVGVTPVGNSALRYDWTFQSLIFYDPSILRVGHKISFDTQDVIFGIEHHGWKDYETPKLKMINNGGILAGSKDFEKFSTQDIIIPKLGVLHHAKDFHVGLGVSYRKSPFKNNLSLSGNSIDTDSTIFGLSYEKQIQLLENKFQFAVAGQYHQLNEFKVSKTSNNENNEAGNKIGAPGYKVGGSIFVLSFGLNWVI